METIAGKPPWNTVQWTSHPNQCAIPTGPIPTGPWEEQQNQELFVLKERIQPFDRSELWDLAKRITNPYERIYTVSNRLRLPPSLCLLKPLSRSFFKMIEILQVMQFFERNKSPKLNSLHLCEGPGGFIEAFLHRAEEQKRTVGTAYGVTLRSTHPMVPGWRRATAFLQKHPNVKLIYGKNNTGDIYDHDVQDTCAYLSKTTGIHLVTADGGFDFSDDFHAQEKSIFRLLIASALIALQCLRQEGDFVLKIFDIQSQATRDFLTLLGACFKEWTLYKPVTSRPCNSEWYFLGKGRIIYNPQILQLMLQLRDFYDAGHTVSQILPENHRESFLQSLQKERMAKQSGALQQVLAFCEDRERSSYASALWEAQSRPCFTWCEQFRMPTLTASQLAMV